MNTQQQLLQAMKNEYIKSRAKDYCYQHFPEDYKVVRRLFDIFTRGDEMFDSPEVRRSREYTRYDIMCEQIENGIDSLIDELVDNYNVNREILAPYKLKILSFYYSDFDNKELYKICKVLGCKNMRLNRINMCKYIYEYICNYI